MKKPNSDEKHQFALFIDSLPAIPAATMPLVLDEPDIVHRIGTVLRMQVADSFILFDRNVHAPVRISAITKKNVTVVAMQNFQQNRLLYPEIIVLLPLLRRDALEAALYSLAEVGATRIQLVCTRKSQQNWSAKDAQRARKILIAAAEQSKQFAMPILNDPLPLEAVLKATGNSFNMLCDPEGDLLGSLPIIDELQHAKKEDRPFIICVGPEGGLTHEEKELLFQHMFKPYALTPTILRACQAMALSAGLLRIILR